MSTACVDWAERLRAGRSIIPAPLFPERAAEALEVFRALRIVDAPGSPTFGESCAPWVFDLVSSIFGAYDQDSGRRLITEWFVLIPKKNAKSTIAAGIMMTALVLNWRESAEFSILAPTVEIANNSFGPSRDMVRKDTDLDALMHVQTHVKTITHRVSNASLKVLAADSDTVGGKKSVGTLVDELWLFGKRPDAENMLREATGGLASRPEGFTIYLTTQSDQPPAGVFAKMLQYARDVRDGKMVDERFVPIIYEYPPEMIKEGLHLDPINFGIVNPNLNYSVDAEFLARELEKSKSGGMESMCGFMAKHLDVEMGLSLRSDRWSGADFWVSRETVDLMLEAVIERSDVLEVGIDGGGLDDMLGLAVLGRDRDTGTWLLWSRAWIHPIALERRKSEAARFHDFAAQGDLIICKAIGDDVADVASIVGQCEAAGVLDKIGVDPVGIGSIVDAIEQLGIDPIRIVGISQGWRMNGAIKTTERKLAEGSLLHGGAPLMAWCVGNAKVEPKGNAVSITKQAAGFAKIDPVMAMFNAVALMAVNPQPSGAGNYMQFIEQSKAPVLQTPTAIDYFEDIDS